MDRIVIDADLPAKITSLKHPAELVDAAGHVVAVAYPKYDPEVYDVYGGELSAEEIERRCQDGRKRYSVDELLAKLRELP